MDATDPNRPDKVPNFRSPKRALARAFFLSRNLWKQRAQQRGQRIKALQVRVRDLELSRELWKTKALHLQEQLRHLLAVSSDPSAADPPLAAKPDGLADPSRPDTASADPFVGEPLPPRDDCASSFQELVHAPLPRSAAAEDPGQKKRRRR